jgi:hypothetical protein
VAPRNTMAAFRAAARLGADGVELDVRVRALDPGVPTALLTAVLPDDAVDGVVDRVREAGHVALRALGR